MVLREQQELHLHELEPLTDAKRTIAYAPESDHQEGVGHLLDYERKYTYRAMSFARGETQPLPGYDDVALHHRRSIQHPHAGEPVWRIPRGSRRNAGPVQRPRRVGAGCVAVSQTSREYSVRAVAYIVAGHELHHWRLFRAICT